MGGTLGCRAPAGQETSMKAETTQKRSNARDRTNGAPQPTPQRSARYDLVMFDLDGTLANSFDFFLGAHNLLSAKHHFRPIHPHEVDMLRRRSPREIMTHVGLPRWKLPLVAHDFMRLMRQQGQQVRLFAGAEQALNYLHAQGILLAVVSSNSVENCRHILGENVCRLLACVDGGTSIFGKRTRITRVLKRLHIPPHRAIYVGDQLTDAYAAHASGVSFGAVCWGYGAPEALAQALPDATFTTVDELGLLANSLQRNVQDHGHQAGGATQVRRETA